MPATDLDPAARSVEQRRRGHDAHTRQLQRLGAGVAELLHGVEEHGCANALAGIGDGQDDSRPAGGKSAGQDTQRLQPRAGLVEGRLVVSGPAAQSLLPGLQVRDLGAQPVPATVEVGEDADQVVGARRAETSACRGRVDLGDEPEPEQAAQKSHDQLCARGSAEQRCPEPLTGHARKTRRRIAAALEKMRIPRTTTTAVDSSPPTPSLSPTNTMSAATSTFEMN